jgi:hypothetical protein
MVANRHVTEVEISLNFPRVNSAALGVPFVDTLWGALGERSTQNFWLLQAAV